MTIMTFIKEFIVPVLIIGCLGKIIIKIVGIFLGNE